jgi:TRAP-type C4-dicarboxylate transport system permease small subunit
VAALNRFVNGIVAVVRWTCIVQVIALFIIVVVAVIARYVFGQAVSWTEEVPRYLLIWISFLAGAVCVLKREHVAFDLIFYAVPKGPRRILALILGGLIAGFGWVMFRYGIVFVQDFGDDLMETIPYTNIWYYVAMPVSGLLIMIFALKLMVDEFTDKDVAAPGGGTVE